MTVVGVAVVGNGSAIGVDSERGLGVVMSSVYATRFVVEVEEALTVLGVEAVIL
jgi:hypothetical protein